jgi:ribosome-associated protein
MLKVTETIAIDPRDLEEVFVRSSGPGGQNVNKVSTAVQLRFDLRNSRTLPDEVRSRLTELAGSRVSTDGVLVITASRFRSQQRNREDARERLAALIRRAVEPKRQRRPTKLPYAAKVRRGEHKRRRSVTKTLRRKVDHE